MQSNSFSSKAELLTRRSADSQKDTAVALADAIRKVSSSGSAVDEALEAEQAEGTEPRRLASFNQAPKKPQLGHRHGIFWIHCCLYMAEAIWEQQSMHQKSFLILNLSFVQSSSMSDLLENSIKLSFPCCEYYLIYQYAVLRYRMSSPKTMTRLGSMLTARIHTIWRSTIAQQVWTSAKAFTCTTSFSYCYAFHQGVPVQRLQLDYPPWPRKRMASTQGNPLACQELLLGCVWL